MKRILICLSLFLSLGFCAQFIEGAAAAAAATVDPKLDIAQVEIRKFNLEDSVEVARAREVFINAFIFSKPKEWCDHYNERFNQIFTKTKTMENHFSYVAIFNEQIVGIIFTSRDGNDLVIEWLATDPSCFRCGIGKKLMNFSKQCFADVEKVTLIPFESSKIFYRKLGFQDLGREMFLMIKNLRGIK